MEKKLFIKIAEHISSIIDMYDEMKPILVKLNFDGRHPIFYEMMEKLMKYNKKKLTDIFAESPDKILSNVFNAYTISMNILINTKKLLKKLKNFSIKSYRGAAASKRSVDKYNDMINKLETIIMDMDNDIIVMDYTNTISEMVINYVMTEYDIKDKDLVDNIINSYEKYKNKHHTALDLSYALIHALLYIEDNAKLFNYVTNIMEQIKSDILPQYKVKRINDKTVIQTLLHTMRIIPHSNYEPLAELLDYNGKLKDIDKIINKYCMDNKINILLICKEDISHTIEYDKWRLLDYDYLLSNDMVHTKTEGINDRIIMRYKNINILNNSEEYEDTIKYKLKPGMHYYDKKNNMCNIIETTDNKYFRFMSMSGHKFIPQVRLNEIIKGKYPSRRILGYNSILDNEIRKHIGEPILYDMVDMNQSIMEDKIIRQFKKKKLYSMKSNTKLKKYINDNFANDFVDILMRMLGYDINDVSIEFKASIFSQIRTFKKDIVSYANKQMFYVKYDKPKTISQMLKNIVEMNILGSKNILAIMQQKERILAIYDRS